MKSKKVKWKIIGYTKDNQPVIAGTFRMVDTLGVPFMIILDGIYKRNFRLCWVTFITEAIESGWKPESAFAKCREGIQESIFIPRDDKKKILETLEWLQKAA